MKLEVVAIFWFLISGCREKMTSSLLHPFNRFFIKNLVFVLIFACFSINASAQVRASARLDTTYIFIGDQVELKLILDSAFNVKGIETDFSVFDSIPTLEVVRHGDWNPVGVNRGSGNGIYEQRVVLTSFENGRHQLPDIPVRFKLNGQPQSLDVPGRVALEVATIAVTDSTQLTPIKPIIEEGRTFEDFLPYIIAIAALGLVIGLVLFYLRMKKKKALPPPPPPPLKPHEIALQKLEALQEAKLWQAGQVKQYQTELTFIIREYLENYFHIPALENTTDEIIESLRQSGISDYWKDKLRTIFQNADLVKFAKAKLPTELHERGMTEAINFINATKPVEQTETVAPVSL